MDAGKTIDLGAEARQNAEAAALTQDVREAAERVYTVWAKAHDPRRAALNAGQHMLAVLQGQAIALGAQAAALCHANGADEERAAWLRETVVSQVGEAFDETLASLSTPPATPTQQ